MVPQFQFLLKGLKKMDKIFSFAAAMFFATIAIWLCFFGLITFYYTNQGIVYLAVMIVGVCIYAIYDSAKRKKHIDKDENNDYI